MQYGVKIYSDYSDTIKWVTAEKPNFSAAVTNTLGRYSYRGYVRITNMGNKPLYILNFANVYPYDGASYSSATDPAYSSLTYLSLNAGYRATLSFKMDNQRYFSTGAHVTFFIKYDGCEYFVSAYENGKAYYI